MTLKHQFLEDSYLYCMILHYTLTYYGILISFFFGLVNIIKILK